jgi:hypothetical protein
MAIFWRLDAKFQELTPELTRAISQTVSHLLRSNVNVLSEIWLEDAKCLHWRDEYPVIEAEYPNALWGHIRDPSRKLRDLGKSSRLSQLVFGPRMRNGDCATSLEAKRMFGRTVTLWNGSSERIGSFVAVGWLSVLDVTKQIRLGNPPQQICRSAPKEIGPHRSLPLHLDAAPRLEGVGIPKSQIRRL